MPDTDRPRLRASMQAFASYWWRVICHALRGTFVFLGFPNSPRIALPATVFVVAVLVLREIGGSEQMNEELRWFVATGLAAAVLFVPTLLGHLLWAPVAIHREQRTRIEALTPPPGVTFSLPAASLQGWVHLAVQNTGPTDVFTAQVSEVVGMVMTVPWSMKWRQGSEEQRLTKGETRLLEVGEVDHGFTHPRDEPQDIYYYYSLLSTTGRFTTYAAIVGKIDTSGPDVEITTPVDEDKLRRYLSLLVEVRGVQHGSVTTTWLNLGFTRDADPLASITAEPTAYGL